MESKKTLIPNYYEDFECIADKCEDTCCAGWQIPIDKKTFKEYKKMQHAGDSNRVFFSGNFSKNKTGSTLQNYGLMRLDSEGRCSFLNNENLCQVVLQYGPDKLCTTCKVFPRNYSFYQSSDFQEVALTTACPEATRKIINLNGKISFTIKNEDKLNALSFVQSNKSLGKDLYAFEIRHTVIRILQSDIYTISEKKIIIGLFIKRVMEEDNIHYIPEIINSFEAILNRKVSLTDSGKESRFAYDLLLFIAKTKQSTNTAFNELIDSSLSKTLKNYEYYSNEMNKFEKIEEMINQKLPFALENYLVNYVYKNNFPFKETDILNDLYTFNLHFSIIKCMVISEMEKLNDPTSEEVSTVLTKIIYSTGRVLEHNNQYFKSILEELKTQSKFTLIHALLIA